MLPRGKRLTRTAFEGVGRGKRAISAHFSITLARTSEGRAAVVVSKKVAKRSVDRHLLKRRVLEAVQDYVLPGRSFIVYARSGSPKLSYQDLATELAGLLDSAPAV